MRYVPGNLPARIWLVGGWLAFTYQVLNM